MTSPRGPASDPVLPGHRTRRNTRAVRVHARRSRPVTTARTDSPGHPGHHRDRRAPAWAQGRREGGRATKGQVYVLDTSVLLSDPAAFRRFAEHEVVLPLVVITELEGKRHHPELGWFARQSLRMLDELRIKHGRLDQPVPVNDVGGTLRVELNHSDDGVLPPGFRNESNDARILSVALNLAGGGTPGHAGQQGHAAAGQGGRGRAAPPTSTGTARPATRPGPAWPRSRWATTTSTSCTAAPTWPWTRRPELPCHTGLVLHSSRGSALARVLPDKVVRLVRGDREAFGLRGRSAEQRIALDLLLDESIGIVSLGGRAGTGKSALALCAGLEAVMERRRHKKVIVFRPLYAVGGQELGYLPGSESEKMSPWAQAVFDTLGAVVHENVRGGGAGPRHARGAAADPHPRPEPARRVRDRRRGAVAGARCPAHRALPDRPGLAGGAHPRRRPARQPAGRPARRRHRGDRGAQGAPAVRARDADPLGALRRSPRWSPTCWRTSPTERCKEGTLVNASVNKGPFLALLLDLVPQMGDPVALHGLQRALEHDRRCPRAR